jgi:uncharacterized repeat protein (TIGR01451 family)
MKAEDNGGSGGGGSSGSRSTKTCRDEKAINYKEYGTHKESLCVYSEETSEEESDKNNESDNDSKEVSKNIVRKINYKYVELDYFKDIILEKEVSLNRDFGYALKVKAEAGDDIYYRFIITNNSDKEIKGLNVIDTLAEELVIIELNDNTSYDDETRKVT